MYRKTVLSLFLIYCMICVASPITYRHRMSVADHFLSQRVQDINLRDDNGTKSITWNVSFEAGNPFVGMVGNGLQIGKTTDKHTNISWKTSDFPGLITRIEVICAGGKNFDGTLLAKVGGCEFGEIHTVGTVWGTAVFQGKAQGEIELFCTQNAVSYLKIQSITVTYDAGKEIPEFSFPKNTLFHPDDKTFVTPELTNPQQLPTAFSSSNPEVAQVDALTGEVTLLGKGTATIIASTEGDEQYYPKLASYTLHVLPSVHTLYRHVMTVASGKSYLLAAAPHGTMCRVATTLSNGYLSAEASPVDGLFTSVDSSIPALIFTYNSTQKAYAIQLSEGGYLGYPGTGQKFLQSTRLPATDKKYFWTLSPQPDGTVSIVNKYAPSRAIYYNTVSDEFCITDDFDRDTTSVTNSFTGCPIRLYEQDDSAEEVWIGRTGYTTAYYATKALVIPTAVEACTYAVKGGNLIATHRYVPGSILPEGTAVVLAGVPGLHVFAHSSLEGEKTTENQLYGYDTDQLTYAPGASKYYMLSLSQSGNEVGFYYGAYNGAPFVSKAHKAFLALAASEAAKEFLFNGTTTHVTLSDAYKNASAVYSLTGMRVDAKSLSPGIYLQGGRKIAVSRP